MAEQIPYGVAASLIDRLASVAFREFGRIYGVMDELERLKNTVESVRAVLLDAEEKQKQNHSVQNWIRRLKDDVLYPADNLLDEFIIEDMRLKADETPKKKLTQVFYSLSPTRIAFRHKMAHEIEKIQKKIGDVVRDMSGLNLNTNVVVVEQSNNVRRETSSYVLESNIIGREDDKKEIIRLLKQPNQNVSLVAIVGIGGLGKTALAQLVYNDGEVTKFFEKSMWVCISNNFGVKTIVKKMLELLTKSKLDDKLSLENLQNMLRENLTGKRYLLVLDDIWNESYEKWAQLRTYLTCGDQDSKVVVTTRTKIVAQTMGVSVAYVLKGLTPEESWDLLKNIVTNGDETKGVNKTLESIGKKIAEKCSGVPLAIRTLGGLLQGKSEEREWMDVLQGDFWKLCEDEDSIMPVLKLSYQSLSPQMRQCFAYCSLYPKHMEIEKNELIQLWMAQGYLDCSAEKQLMEDIGNQFVNLFLKKSLFQDAKIDVFGNIHRFKIHDLIHDLAMQVAGNDCRYLDSETTRLVGSPVHVMVKSDAISLLESLDASKLRTLILLTNISQNWNEKEVSVILKFKYLRVLKISCCSLSKVCESIGKLKHLRYLNLWHCRDLRGISKSVSNFVCLQTLILRQCNEVKFYAKGRSKLINLRYLDVKFLKASEEKKLTSGIGRLGVSWWNNGVIFVNWFSLLTNIVIISLHQCRGLQYLPPLERLPFLKLIHLNSLDELEYIYYEKLILPEIFFPSLERLLLCKCKKLRGWWRMGDDVNDNDTDNSSKSHNLSVPSFPSCFSYLSINDCEMLTCMPNFPNLDKALTLINCNLETLEATINMVGSKCSIESTPLSMLKSLILDGVQLDMKKYPKDWVQNLTSLEHLVFMKLPSRTFQEIEIWFKDELNYLPSLQNIEVSYCSDLKSLPDWICNLSSLQHITIKECQNLTSLPKRMSRLANLQTLEITECPLLLEECETQTSAAWSNIAHIPNIILKRYVFL